MAKAERAGATAVVIAEQHNIMRLLLLLLASAHPCSAYVAAARRPALSARRPRAAAVVAAATTGPAALLGELATPPPPDSVVAAVEKLPPNQRVVAADVAAKGGISLDTAEQGLRELASALAGADGLSVAASDKGDLVYRFPDNVRGELASRSSSAKAREAWKSAKPVLATVGRVSFGVALIASIVIVYAAIIAIQSSSDEERRDDRRSGGGGMLGGGGWGYNPFWSPLDLFFPRPYYYYSYWEPPPEMSLPEAFFSFVFGDGDPNTALRAARVRALAGVVRANGGAVVAEQLAPYLDPPSLPGRDVGSALVDESWVLPATLELGGRPEVQPDGTIVYTFDELKVSALETDAAVLLADPELAEQVDSAGADELRQLAADRGVGVSGPGDVKGALRQWAAARLPQKQLFPEGYLEERTAPFSNADGGQLLAAGALGVANFVGVGYLGSLLAGIPAGVQLPGVIGLAATLYPALVLYAAAYVVVPAVRFGLLQRSNAAIEERNAARRAWRDALGAGSGALKARLTSARGAAGKRGGVRVVGEEQIDFDSAKSVYEQPTDAEGDDWEKRLGARG